MTLTIPREWHFQGWLALRTPWAFEPKCAARVGNALLASFPGMTNAAFDEKERRINFTENRKDNVRANVSLSPSVIWFNLWQLQGVEEWVDFSTSVLGIIHSQTDVFEARFNLLQARQSVYIPIREVRDPGIFLWSLLGKPTFADALTEESKIAEIGVDQEYVFQSNRYDKVKVILRFQVSGPSSPPYLRRGEILVNLSTVLDPEPAVVETITERWAEAQDELLRWLSDRIHPMIIVPLTTQPT